MDKRIEAFEKKQRARFDETHKEAFKRIEDSRKLVSKAHGLQRSAPDAHCQEATAGREDMCGARVALETTRMSRRELVSLVW